MLNRTYVNAHTLSVLGGTNHSFLEFERQYCLFRCLEKINSSKKNENTLPFTNAGKSCSVANVNITNESF